jgi:hypothetical protein
MTPIEWVDEDGMTYRDALADPTYSGHTWELVACWEGLAGHEGDDWIVVRVDLRCTRCGQEKTVEEALSGATFTPDPHCGQPLSEEEKSARLEEMRSMVFGRPQGREV